MFGAGGEGTALDLKRGSSKDTERYGKEEWKCDFHDNKGEGGAAWAPGEGWNEEMEGGEEGVESWKSKSSPGKPFGLCPWAQHSELSLIVLCEELPGLYLTDLMCAAMRNLCSFPRSVAFLKHNYLCSSGRCRCPWNRMSSKVLPNPKPAWDCDSVPHELRVWQISQGSSSGPGHMLMRIC